MDAVGDGRERAVAVRDDVPVPEGLGRIGGRPRHVAGAGVHDSAASLAPGRECQSVRARLIEDLRDSVVQLAREGGERSVGPNEQCLAVVHGVPDRELADDPLRTGGQVGIDPHLGAVDVDLASQLPVAFGRRCVRLAAAEDQQVGERIGPGGPAVRSGRESNRADEIGELSHLSARGGVGGVECVVAGQQRHQPAGACQGERLDDEVVVQAVSGPVVGGVVQSHVGEGDVPDRQIAVAVRQPRVRERLGADIRGGVKRSGDRGGRGVEFHTGQLRAVGRDGEEHARAAARLEHAPGAETELCDKSPYLAGDCGVGVVRVDRGPPRGRVGVVVEQPAQLLAIRSPSGLVLVE